MKTWHYVLAIVLVLATAATLITPWRQSPARPAERASNTWPPPTPWHDDEPRICRRSDAVAVTGEDLSNNLPRPELSVRTDARENRIAPLDVQLIVDTDGRVICAEAVSGHEPYRARAQALAKLWHFKPFKRNGQPIVVALVWPMPLRWMEVRPPQKVPFPEITDWHTLHISLERGSCYGTCPTYKIEISSDGRVEYNGGRFVALLGKHTSTLPKEALENLFDQFRRADFFWLNETYAARVSDSAAHYLDISFDGHHKRVVDYIGLEVGMPDAVTNLEHAIDEAVDSERWTLGNKNTARSLKEENWNFQSRAVENLTIVAGVTSYGEPDALRDVIALGAPVNARADMRQSRTPRTSTAMDAAITRGDPEILQILLATHRWTARDINEALLSAASYGSMAMIAPLVAAGGNVLYTSPPGNQPDDLPFETPGDGRRTVLMNAAGSGMPDVVEMILKAKPDVNARDDHGWTALHFAVQIGGPHYRESPPSDSARVVELLLAAGADVNARTARGTTPLGLSDYSPEAARALIKAGAKK